MKWLSRFRVGDLVEVRSKEEILATLDERGCRDGMQFMPEMLKYCGQQMRVRAVAHKTCETAHQTWKGRRLNTAVHLEGSHCDGSAHGGCQADCNLFWKDDWIKPSGTTVRTTDQVVQPKCKAVTRCSEAQLLANTQHNLGHDEGGIRFRCQATELYDATYPLF